MLVRDGESSIDVATCDTLQMRRVRRERVAMVFQQFGLLPWRTVRENVGFGLELRGEGAAARKTIVDEKLELVGLSQWADRYVSELSGGMQQRVGLARAFATDADILLMDEPFSALDPLIRGKLQDELLALQERVKKTILFVSHDLDEALRLGRSHLHPAERAHHSDRHGRGHRARAGRRLRGRVRAPHESARRADRRHDHAAPRAHAAGDGDTSGSTSARRYRLSLNSADEALGLQLDGVEHALRHVQDDADARAASSRASPWRPPRSRCNPSFDLRQATGHPVLLAEDGKIVGVCGEAEIIRALAGSRHVAS